MATLRHTTQRQTVLRTVKFSTRPMTAVEVERLVQRACPGIARATVYRNLQYFVERGELYRIESRDGHRRYVGHAHHTAIFTCQRCGRVRQLRSRSLPVYVDRKMFGDHLITISELTASGLCTSCRKKLS